MTYIVTTKRPPRHEHNFATFTGKWRAVESRRDVATLDEASRCPECEGSGTVAIPYREYDPRRSTMCSWCSGYGRFKFPESGGTVGPLPDGSIITIERIGA